MWLWLGDKDLVRKSNFTRVTLGGYPIPYVSKVNRRDNVLSRLFLLWHNL